MSWKKELDEKELGQLKQIEDLRLFCRKMTKRLQARANGRAWRKRNKGTKQ